MRATIDVEMWQISQVFIYKMVIFKAVKIAACLHCRANGKHRKIKHIIAVMHGSCMTIQGITKTSPCNECPITPHFLYSKTGVYRGIYCFLIFALKHRLWVLICNSFVFEDYMLD